MARPKKNNADYFSHDKDMRNDAKIRALRRKYSHTGYAVWSYMLEVLTDSDYFEIEWNDLQVELLAGDFDMEPEQLQEIIEYCTSVLHLFTIENGVLFSETLKNRFESVLSKRKREQNGVIDVENPQSKVKESKGEESKENNTPPLSPVPGEAEIQKTGVDNPTPNRMHTDSPPAPPKGKRKSCAKKKNRLDLSFIEPAFQPIMTDWLAYKSERGQAYRQQGVKACYTRLRSLSQNDPQTARSIISQSMSNNWAGFYPLKQPSNHDPRTNNSRNLPDNPVYRSDNDQF